MRVMMALSLVMVLVSGAKSEESVVIHKGAEPPPAGTSYSYFEDYPADQQAKLKVWVAPAKASQAQEPFRQIILNGKKCYVIKRGQTPPPDSSFCYEDTVKEMECSNNR